MRVKISASPPLPPVRAWFPLALPSVQSISSFKSLLCASLPDFGGVSPCSLRLSIDGFELLDNSEFTVVRDGDLICVEVRSQDATQKHVDSRKRKRRMSTPSSSSSESETSSPSSESESDSESTSDSDGSLRKAEPPKRERAQVQPKPDPSTFVPPGYGKAQTRSRNLRRRLKRVHERESPAVSQGGPVSGANATTPVVSDGNAYSGLLSLSLRNKNKAKNFKSLLGRPLAPKIIFETTKPQTALIPPSSRSSLPANLFVTSIDVEAGLQREKKKRKMRDEADISLDYGDAATGAETDIEAIVGREWATLAKVTSERQVAGGMVVGYKALGIHAGTNTPEECLTVARVVSCDGAGVVVRALGARGEAAFGGPVEGGSAAAEGHTWRDVLTGDWRLTSSLGTDPVLPEGGI